VQLPKIKLHSLITMEEIVDYMIYKKNISQTQLKRLINDYRGFERWKLPKFAQ
jgi:orotate phosphoribosyltransferase